MTNSEQDIDLIERYLEDTLTSGEKEHFEGRLLTDERFKTAFHTYKNLIQGIHYSGKKNLLQKLRKLEDSLTAQEKREDRTSVFKINSFYYYSAAAAVLLLMVVSLVYYLNTSISPAEVYAQNFQPYPNVISVTTRGYEDPKTLKEKAFRLYDLEEYDKAAEDFEKILKTGDDPEALLYAGNSYLALANFDSAVSKLSRLKSIESPFKSQAEWYLALSYLGKDEVGKSKELLAEISRRKISYSKRAVKILKSLN